MLLQADLFHFLYITAYHEDFNDCMCVVEKESRLHPSKYTFFGVIGNAFLPKQMFFSVQNVLTWNM